jgi:hypothetical protein
VKLLDTTVLVDYVRGHAPALELVRALVARDEGVSSELVRFELLSGARPDELDRLERACAALGWIPVDEAVARTAADLARRYRLSHSGIDDVDYLIAATALELDAELVTTNVRHYPMLAGLEAPY